jgi:DNA polymerase-3 subunit beta
MKLTIHKSDLSKLIDRVRPAVAAKANLPILTHILLEAVGDKLTARATDLTVSVLVSTAADVASPGSAAIPAGWLADAVKAMPVGDIQITLDRTSVTVKAAKGKQRLKGPCMPAEDFPVLPALEPAGRALILGSDELAGLLGRVAYAMGTDETRPHLNCVRVESSGSEVRAVTTDGHRLAMTVLTSESAECVLQVPARAVRAVQKLAAEHSDKAVSIHSGGGSNGYLHFEWPTVSLAVKRTDDAFPPYAKVVPQSCAHSVRMPKVDLVDAIKCARVASPAIGGGVRLELSPGKLTVRAESGERGEAESELDVDFTADKLAIGIHADYALEALSVIADDDVLLKLSGPLDPIVLVGAEHPEASMAVVMPMRIG